MELLNEPVEPSIQGMDSAGWSNSPAASHAPDDVAPEVQSPQPSHPGWSNEQAVTEQASPVTQPDTSQAPRKTTAKKKG